MAAKSVVRQQREIIEQLREIGAVMADIVLAEKVLAMFEETVR
jgi:hypothetical protein